MAFQLEQILWYQLARLSYALDLKHASKTDE